jgi:hypothetical protein
LAPRRDRHDGEHPLLEVSGNIAQEEVGAWRQVDAARLGTAWIDVLAVANQGDAGALFLDIARGIGRVGGRSEVALEHQKLVRSRAVVHDREVRLARLDRTGDDYLPFSEADGLGANRRERTRRGA